MLKNRLKKEGSQLVTNCNQLKMKSQDGKMRFTDVADTAQLLRIIEEQTGKPVITGDNAVQLNRVVTDLIEDVSGRSAGDTEGRESEK